MSTVSVARKVAAQRPKCVECGALLTAERLKWRAKTCSADCGEALQRRNRIRREHNRPKLRGSILAASSSQNPPILGVTLIEAAVRIGISHQMAHNLCVEHGLGRRYGDSNSRRWRPFELAAVHKQGSSPSRVVHVYKIAK